MMTFAIFVGFLLQTPAHASSATVVPGYAPLVMPVPTPWPGPRRPSALPVLPRPESTPVVPGRDPETRMLPRPRLPAPTPSVLPFMRAQQRENERFGQILNTVFDGVKPAK